LQQLRIRAGEFGYVVSLRRSLAEGQSALRGEWEDLAAIIIQVYKRHCFERWRHEEQMGGLFLAPQLFQIPESPSTETPAPWRYDARAHRMWRTALLARIDQQRTVTDEFHEAIDRAEAETLPLLRDALVQVAGKSLPELSTQYAIDVAAGSCQTTTRVGQAITSVQSIIRAARAGKLRSKGLSFDGPNFEEEWRWLGSYATWRSAMFTFIYPENLLLPRLKPLRTPGYDQLMEDLRGTRALDRHTACEIAQRYSDYLDDVWPLEPQCHVRQEPASTLQGAGPNARMTLANKISSICLASAARPGVRIGLRTTQMALQDNGRRFGLPSRE
jgi:hypothetical protein